MSTFSIKTVVVEEVGAWITCKRCLGFGWVSEQIANGITANISDKTCPTCQGKGGAWHEAVILSSSKRYVKTYRLVHKPVSIMNLVTKSTTLVREWARCTWCGGKSYMQLIKPKQDVYSVAVRKYTHIKDPCSHCHKDEQGNSTGCEPGTQGEWEVADD